MDTADKIGLLTGFGWLAGHSFVVTLLLCWFLTPVLHCLVGLVFEDRWVPLSSDKQFLSFFPGDLFLGVAVAGLLVLAQRLPERQAWYNTTWWHLVVLLVALVVASVMTYLEWKSGAYPSRAMYSPTKLYHNFLLYGGYGYVSVATLVSVVFGLSWSWSVAGLLLLCLLPGFAWMGLVVKDNSLSSHDKSTKLEHAHVVDWKPFWVR